LPVPTQLLTPRNAALMLETPVVPEAGAAHADLLYAGWLAQKRRPRLPLMPPEVRTTHRAMRIREWGWRAAVAVLLLAIVMTGWQASNLILTLNAARQEVAELATEKQKLITEQVAATGVSEPLGKMRKAIERRHAFSAPSATPWMALGAISHGIGDGARLVKLDWHSDKPADESMQVDLRLLQAKPEQPVDKEATAAQVQKLTQNVAAAMPGYEVRLAHYPFPALPGEALSNEGAEKSDKSLEDTAELDVRKTSP
jgi:hypothetical protein